ncbi:hypothetical protein LOTGIDRAFT_238294 [Lottia gigantea]|uniref:Protein FAM33A n=1 Tax=Lottia gigantea TaxID=225164 RepID=V4AVV1_LOTGI|nr:hypothetical protein LOTGIDRAFT_238294 [Lottia gigantea]ESP01508.1 hypothetical protein LOTGIDRAFT_238294 [Lottia gigantea]
MRISSTCPTSVGVQAELYKADSDLNYLSRKVEFELENSSTNGQTPNPVKMLEKISNIKKEFSSISQDALEIQKTQKEAMDYFRSQLLSACQMVQKLSDQTGVEGSEPPPDLSELSSLLNFDIDQVNQTSDNVAGQNQEQACSSNSSKAAPPEELSASELRSQSKEFVEVSDDEFQSVSELVRGRVKLADVNSVYQVLWRYFKEEKNKKPLKLSDLHKMGCKVSGATGEAKLKVLRSLKIVQLTKGEVALT